MLKKYQSIVNLALSLGLILTGSLAVLAQSRPPLTNARKLIVAGTEPFWSVTITPKSIVYSSPDGGDKSYPYSAPIAAAGRPSEYVRVFRLNGKTSGTLMLKKTDRCSDGMSDNIYPYDAVLILGNKVLEGCGRYN